MAIPTPVNGQITDSVTQAHLAGGEAALNAINELLQGIAQSLNAAQGFSACVDSLSDISETLSLAFEKAESELQEILENF